MDAFFDENNFGEVEKHLQSIAKIKKYKKHFFFGDLNLSNTSWPDGSTNNATEKLFVELFDELGMQQMVDVPTHNIVFNFNLLLFNTILQQ